MVLPPREWICNNVTSRLHALAAWPFGNDVSMKVILNHVPFYHTHIIQISSMYEFCAGCTKANDNILHSICIPFQILFRFYISLPFVWCIITRHFKYVNHSEKAHWKVLPCAEPAGLVNDWVDSNGTDGKPTFHRRANLSSCSKICNHFGEIATWSRKSLRIIKVFWKKRPLKGKFSKN